MASDRTTITGSERRRPDVSEVGPIDPDARATISLYLKRIEAPSPTNGGAPARPEDRESMRRRRETTLGASMDAITAFAESQNLLVVERDPARRRLAVSGRLEDLAKAFGAQIEMFGQDSRPFRARSGALSAPSEVASLLEAALGFDQRPVATPKSIRRAASATNAGHLPNAVTALYGFPPTPGSGSGQCVAIIELGGGVSGADTQAAFQAMGLAAPKVTSVAVGDGADQPGKDPNADGEVALDVQVAGAGAPGAELAVYFAPNTDQGFVDAISQAAHDATLKPAVMSISWGSAESGWTGQAVTAMTSALQDAADLGVCVFAASGDGLATDGVSDGHAHVDFPASSPWVVGCGGTRLGATAHAHETVWNSNGGGTGGGVSALFPVPAFQAGASLPKPVGGAAAGRGVPDVAADADPDTGYRVVVDGQTQVIGGTSAAAPLWAGLFALVTELAGRPVGPPHATLYAHPEAFNDVVHGDNRKGAIGYSAAKGWDACTGLGTPKAAAVAALFKSAN